MTPVSVSVELVERLFEATAHGDADHRAWLREAYTAFFSGKPVPAPRGKGNKEAKIAALLSQVEQLGREKERMREALVEARGYVDQCVITGRFATPKGLFARIDAALTSESSNATEQPAVGGD